MADMSTPLKGVAFTLCFTLYKNDGTVVANPGTYTKKYSIDGAAVDNIAANVTEEDTTYGQLSLVLSAGEMNGDWIWIYITDDTAGTVPLTMTIYPAAYNAGAEAALVHAHAATIEGDVAAVHTHAQAIIDDVALVHTHVSDCATATVLGDVHTDVGTAIADVAATHVHAAGGETQATAAAADASAAHAAADLIHTHVEDCATATVLGDVHADVGTAITNLATVDTVVDGIETHVHAVDGHIGADYGATEKAAIDLLDDAVGGLLDVHTDVADVHGDVADIHADVGVIVDGVWDEAIAGHAGAGSTGLALAGASAPTANAVADQVWDEVLAGHAGVGSTGEALASAGAAGDPWNTTLPGAYGAGKAGKIVGDNVNAPLATIDTVVDAIKAKTDTIGAGTVTVTSPVASDGVTVTTYRGDDYKQHEGREIRWLIATPDLSTAVTTLHVGALDIVCTLVDGGLATQSVYAELTAAQTATLLEARGLYSVTAAMADSDVRTLVVGEWKSEIRVA